MTEPNNYSYPRYLKAKKTVDARALNRRVWDRFLDHLTDGLTLPLRILEIGGGIGATVERLCAALESRSVDRLQYTFVDVNPHNVETAAEELHVWALDRGYQVKGKTRQVWTGRSLEVSIRFVTADLFDYVRSYRGQPFNAVIAQAMLDIVDSTKALNALKTLLTDNGLWYLPIHFDGVTAFEPTKDLDTRIERLYHASMVETLKEEGGRQGVHCGRHLLNHFQQSSGTLLEAGSSDWIVHPQNGGYPAEEAYFLHHILRFIDEELRGHPDLDKASFSTWIQERRRQINSGILIYVAHQLDLLAQAP